MEQRRFLVFFLVSLAIWMAWIQLAVPRLFPELNKKLTKTTAKLDEKRVDKADQNTTTESDPKKDGSVAAGENEPKAPAANQPAIEIPRHASVRLQLGPEDPEKEPQGLLSDRVNEFFLAANLNSEGAAVDFVEITDKVRYPAFGRRGDRVRVIGSLDSESRSRKKTSLKTFALQSPQIDKLLGKTTLDRVAWEVVPESDPKFAGRVGTFRFTSPDRQWELTKRFELTQLTLDELKKENIGQTFVDGYKLNLKITLKNLTDQVQQLNYSLQGPVGVPLEDAENSYKYRDVRMGFIREDGSGLDENKLSAAETVKKERSDKTLEWTRKLKYLGIDVLYFAALVIPGEDQVKSAKAVVANEFVTRPEFSDVSVQLSSTELQVPANGEVVHEYNLFAGPKRKELIGQIPAMAVMDYGWFDPICRGMVWLLNMFHGLGLSYGIAIICLTALVRTLLMPISKHQAANAAKMKELQPKIMARQKELEAKYGKGTEEYMRAAQDLSKEQLGLMMSGCLPVFLQLPIFIALYRAIGSSIELRMEPFLWFENLASPDALFRLPFVVPWLGWTDFNLLPCISTGLMFIHQKLTMPPPTNEEQAQQQKMMGFMMIFMGAMFFRVPSGLCLYFIATNIWSMTERWLFEHLRQKKAEEAAETVPEPVDSSSKKEKEKEPEKPSVFGGIWDRLQPSADTQHSATRQLDSGSSSRSEKKKKKR